MRKKKKENGIYFCLLIRDRGKRKKITYKKRRLKIKKIRWKKGLKNNKDKKRISEERRQSKDQKRTEKWKQSQKKRRKIKKYHETERKQPKLKALTKYRLRNREGQQNRRSY